MSGKKATTDTQAVRAVDLVIGAHQVLPIVPEDTLLDEHAVVVDAGRIVAVLPRADVPRHFKARRTLKLDDHVLMPGLVNAHTHSPMILMRGMADDLPLMEWLEKHIWPVEHAVVGPDFIRDGMELAIAEMLLGGTTCINEHYHYPNIAGQACERLGFRARVGCPVLDTATAWASTSDEFFARAGEVHAEFRDSALVTTAFAPHAPYTVSDGNFERIREMSADRDMPVHLHLHETAGEVEDSLRQFGVRPLERLQRLGLVNERLIAVHMTAVTEADVAACAEAGVSVVHCPESNLKLASGFCPAEHFRQAGVNLAIGTDGCASNNDLDMFGETRTAALLAKAVAGRADAFNAPFALQAATLGGARALGLARDIGSIEPGKQADLIAVKIRGELGSQPLYDTRSQLVYAGQGLPVTDVWIAGKPQVQGGELVNLDKADLLARAGHWRDRIAAL